MKERKKKTDICVRQRSKVGEEKENKGCEGRGRKKADKKKRKVEEMEKKRKKKRRRREAASGEGRLTLQRRMRGRENKTK